VYAFAGTPETFEQRALAACLAIGRGAVLSHRSAGRMWDLCRARRGLDVTVQGSVGSEPPGVRVHRTTTLERGDAGKLRGVPVTSPARTLIDLAAVLTEAELERALQAAVVNGRVDAAMLREKVLRTSGRGRRGPAALRSLLPECERRSHVWTPLERLVADVLRSEGLPPFHREHAVYAGGTVFYLDFAYPDHLVGIEADGRRWHSDAAAFEHDRAKHNALTAAGWKILRVTDRQIRTDADGVRAQLHNLVGLAAGNRH
jgi:very-short-patch-repair endonuclease